MVDIPTSAEEVIPLTVGAKVPGVFLRKVNGERVTFHSLLKRPVVVVFYRGGWCPYCNIQLSGLRTIEKELDAMGLDVLAVSPDQPEKLKESQEKGALDYTLLSDSDMDVAKAFGIAFRVDDQTIEKYKGFNIDLEDASGRTHHLLPVPSVFIVDRGGVIRFAHANADYKVRLSPEEVMAAAKTLAKEEQE